MAAKVRSNTSAPSDHAAAPFTRRAPATCRCPSNLPHPPARLACDICESFLACTWKACLVGTTPLAFSLRIASCECRHANFVNATCANWLQSAITRRMARCRSEPPSICCREVARVRS
eukprot:1508355-Pleurochrysis_carterae.AAC.4